MQKEQRRRRRRHLREGIAGPRPQGVPQAKGHPTSAADPTHVTALLQQRNVLVGAASPFAIAERRLPAPLADAFECERCPEAAQCMLVHRALEPAHASGAIHADLFEPLDTMVEAAVALCTASPDQLHARIAYSLDLLLELQRPVYDLSGREPVAGWQPGDLPGRLAAQRNVLDVGQGGGYGLDRD